MVTGLSVFYVRFKKTFKPFCGRPHGIHGMELSVTFFF